MLWSFDVYDTTRVIAHVLNTSIEQVTVGFSGLVLNTSIEQVRVGLSGLVAWLAD